MRGLEAGLVLRIGDLQGKGGGCDEVKRGGGRWGVGEAGGDGGVGGSPGLAGGSGRWFDLVCGGGGEVESGL